MGINSNLHVVFARWVDICFDLSHSIHHDTLISDSNRQHLLLDSNPRPCGYDNTTYQVNEAATTLPPEPLRHVHKSIYCAGEG